MRALVLLFALFTGVARADVAVFTYNMAQIERFWIDFVPCTSERLPHQVAALLTGREALIHIEPHFVLLLQEVFKPSAYVRLKEASQKLGFRMLPATAQEASENGLVTITNLPVLESRFVAFTQDNFAQKGILYTLLGIGPGHKLAVANVHTVFSNTSVLNETHIKQFQEIGKFITQTRQKYVPFIVGGDFNAGPDMKYATEFYPMAQTIWHRGLIPVMAEHKMKWVDYVGSTWDNANPLILNPSTIIKAMNYWEQGSSKWELSDSKMDHIFITDDLKVKSSRLVMKEFTAMKCPGRTDTKGLGPLSDHYGLMVQLKD